MSWDDESVYIDMPAARTGARGGTRLVLPEQLWRPECHVGGQVAVYAADIGINRVSLCGYAVRLDLLQLTPDPGAVPAWLLAAVSHLPDDVPTMRLKGVDTAVLVGPAASLPATGQP